MSEQEMRLTMADGVTLAAHLYLPDGSDPAPCLLEALPYRKDDLTSSYAEDYLRLRDDFGFAVCRLDLRGTGSSAGDALDEYAAAEQRDLHEVIAWLADQDWCNGRVGMFGTSYSGFNSLQMACERPAALGAICAIYATDDRFTDDVHWRGGALRLVDLIDYCHYMTPMNLLPPVPAVWGEGWRAEWLRRCEAAEPWLLTWLDQSQDGGYWRHGSVRTAVGEGYDRIACPTMIVAGWADGYRNASLRTVQALARAGVPHRLLAGPWAHADPATAMPGPRLDLTREMAGFFDTWLRGDGTPSRPPVEIFVRTSTRPDPALEDHEGFWIADSWPSPHSSTEVRRLGARGDLVVEPDVGVAAWIDCAGHLPWGQSDDQRLDDARSLTWEWPGDDRVLLGYPQARLRLSSSAPDALVSLKLCDVFPDGTSALIARGTLDLAFARDGVHAPPVAVPVGQELDVLVDLDACAYRLDPGHTLRLSLAGADWPNVASPPAPLTLTVLGGTLELPRWDGDAAQPDFLAGAEHSGEDPDGLVWETTHDVLRRRTTCRVDHGSTYDVPHGGSATEHYAGTVSVDRRTFAQVAEAEATFDLSWPGVRARATATLRVEVTAQGYEVAVDTRCEDDGEVVHARTWRRRLPRHPGP